MFKAKTGNEFGKTVYKHVPGKFTVLQLDDDPVDSKATTPSLSPQLSGTPSYPNSSSIIVGKAPPADLASEIPDGTVLILVFSCCFEMNPLTFRIM